MDEIDWEIFIEKKDERRYYIKVALKSKARQYDELGPEIP
jgi:hypothetical protein